MIHFVDGVFDKEATEKGNITSLPIAVGKL